MSEPFKLRYDCGAYHARSNSIWRFPIVPDEEIGREIGRPYAYRGRALGVVIGRARRAGEVINKRDWAARVRVDIGRQPAISCRGLAKDAHRRPRRRPACAEYSKPWL